MHSDLSLFEATAEQVLESRKRTYEQWGRGTSIELYLQRDQHLDRFEHADGSSIDGTRRLTTWVLAPRVDPKTLEFKCSVETFRRPGVAAHEGNAQEVICYGVASVFTPPASRGRGYAAHMMHLLHWVLAPSNVLGSFPEQWGSPPDPVAGAGNGTFSVLYSDIGTEFYKRCGPLGKNDGWIVDGARATVFDVARSRALLAGISVDDTILLSEPEVYDLWDKTDAKHISSDLAASSSSRTTFSFLPSHGVGAFQMRRTIFFLSEKNRAPLEAWGARVSGTDNYITWTLDVKPAFPTLIATRLRASPSVFPALLVKALEAAGTANMEYVEVWNLPGSLTSLAEKLGGKTEDRDEHLSAFKWYGKADQKEVDWAHNEKFCWC